MAADKLEQRPSKQRHKDSAALASSSPKKPRYKTPGGFPCSGTRKHSKQSLGKRRFYVKLMPPPPPNHSSLKIATLQLTQEKKTP